MQAALPRPDDSSVIDIARVLVLLQGGIALVSTLEVSFWAAFADPAGVLGASVLLTAAVAVTTFVLAAGLGRRVRSARRLALTLEALVLVWALVDLALALFLTEELFGLVPLLTRVVLPAAVIVLLRRPAARAAFQAKRPSATPAGALS